jgi:hypothetical protein
MTVWERGNGIRALPSHRRPGGKTLSVRGHDAEADLAIDLGVVAER